MNSKRTKYEIHGALIIICLILACPALYALHVSTLSLEEAFITPPKLFPPSNDLIPNVKILFTDRNFDRMITNTLIVAAVVVVGKTALSMLAGLAFVYYEFPGKWTLFFVVLLTLLLPTEIILQPLFRLVSQLEWGGDHPRLSLTMPFMSSALGVFLFRQHFSNIPRELAEAAQLDGATPLRFMVSVLLPISWNVISAHAIIQFIYMWNQYMWPIFAVQNPEDQMIQVGVRTSIIQGTQTDFGVLMAAGVVASIPPMIIFVILKKRFMSGFSLTREK